MEIQEVVKEHNITDYDFVFTVGPKLSISVDHDTGDTGVELPDRFEIHISAKPNLSDPDDPIDEQDLIVYKVAIAHVTIRKRKQRMPTQEELQSMRKFIHAVAKGIQ